MFGGAFLVLALCRWPTAYTEQTDPNGGCSCMPNFTWHEQQRPCFLQCSGNGASLNDTWNGRVHRVVLENMGQEHLLEILNDVTQHNNLTYLSITDSVMRDLQDVTLDDTITSLSLKRVYIKALRGHFFGNLHNLLRLSLEQNQIHYIDTVAFWGLNRLLFLDLSNNKLQYVYSNSFRDIYKLEYLNLSRNNFQHIPGNTFQPLRRLVTLDLSWNKLKSIDRNGLKGLHSLRTINLGNNNFTALPTGALLKLGDPFELDFSSNPVRRLVKNSVSKLLVSGLKMNDMALEIVQRESFHHLQHLTSLEMKDNVHLKYIDSAAFVGLPNLRLLDVSGNGLTVVEKEMISDLPSLHELVLAGNPFVCDCNLHWIREEMVTEALNVSFLKQMLSCTDGHGNTHSLEDVGLSFLGKTCAPSIPDLTRPVTVNEGKRAKLICRAFGLPKPVVMWKIPTGRFLTTGQSDGLWAVDSSGTLYIKHVVNGTTGNYTCVAKNSEGVRRKNVVVEIDKLQAEIVVLRIGDTFIRFSWRHTDTKADFVVTYRKEGELNETSVSVGAHLKSTTASHLKPNTLYILCIKTKNALNANCKQVKTRDSDFSLLGITDLKHYITGISLGVIGLFLLISIALYLIIRRYNKIHRLKSDSEVGLFSSSNDSLSSGMLFENRAASVYSTCEQGPSTATKLPSSKMWKYSDSEEEDEGCTVEINTSVVNY